MPAIPRSVLLAHFKEMIERNEPIVGGGAGTGLSAKSQERGGVDLLIIYNSGRYRMAGRGSLAGLMAYGNANAIVAEMGSEVLPIVERVPVIAGVNGTDPFVVMPDLLRRLASLGFSGVQNFPTVGLIDGVFRLNLEETGMSYSLEVDMIGEAHCLELLTTPYVFTPDEAEAMVKAGADVLVCHMGLTTGGQIGAVTGRTLDECVELIETCAERARRIRNDIVVLCHGGPISRPPDAKYIMERCPSCNGFFGASSMERLPTEEAIAEQARAFKAIGRAPQLTGA